jgi:ADP-heptose:LPS heptosyltransferase
MRWFWQKRNFELGNFVSCTPAILLSSEKMKAKVPVFFDNKEIASLYTHCPFIEILGLKPKGIAFATSSCPIKRKPNESDAYALCRILYNSITCPPTYVDKNITMKLNRDKHKKYAAVFHGCLTPKFFRPKDIGLKTRQKIIASLCERGIVPVLLGTQMDFQNYWRNVNIVPCMNFIGKLRLKDSVSILSQCDFFISNDTGLYHVAGALNMRGLVLWNRTDPYKNRSPCNRISHIVNPGANYEKYKRGINEFLDKGI